VDARTVQMKKSRSLVGVVLLVVALLASACGEATHTVTVDGPVTVEKASPTSPQHRHRSHPTATTEEAEFVSCDSNIEAKAATTTCPFAENVFWTYWSGDEAGSLQVWSPAVQATFATTCDSDGVRSPARPATTAWSRSRRRASTATRSPKPTRMRAVTISDRIPTRVSHRAEHRARRNPTIPALARSRARTSRTTTTAAATGSSAPMACTRPPGGIQGACSHHGGVAP
jgi:hypothetical protein